MTGLLKRGQIWYIRYTVPGGKRRWEAIGTSKRRAEIILGQRRRELEEGRYVPHLKGLSWSYGQLLDRYLEYGKVVKKASTAKLDAYVAKQIREAFSELTLKQITPQAVLSYVEGKLASGLAPSTVNYRLSILKHSFAMAVKWGLLHTNPLSGVRLPVKINNMRKRYLTPEEITQLLNTCPPLWRRLSQIALHSGMRKGEILAPEWDQIDFTGSFARLPDTKNGDQRLVPLGSTAIEVL